MNTDLTGNGHGEPKRAEQPPGLVVAQTYISPKPRCPWCGRDQELGMFLPKGRHECEYCVRLFFYQELWHAGRGLVYVTCPAP